ncbi:MAG: putative 2OG-Fe(II) oxygenase, partial [Burkholderiales bacterium]
GGHLTSHIHETGWLSGSLYLAMPGANADSEEGSIEFSTHGDNYPQRHAGFPKRTISPHVGDIVLFPSSLFHRTIPFSSTEERVCIAFDVKPL